MPFLKGLLRKIYQERPDILFIHDVGPSLVTGMFYKILNPAVRVHLDCHSTPANARTSLIGPFYHFLFRLLFVFFAGSIERFFAISPETVEFMTTHYGIKRQQITLLPLPGDSSGLVDKQTTKTMIFEQLGITSECRIVLHSGKMPGDKETLCVLESFCQIADEKLRLILVGSVDKSFRITLDQYKAKDSRIMELGWLSAAELRDVMLACDVMVQPGSLSNSFIDAICCGAPVILDDTPQGRYLTKGDNGVVISRENLSSLASQIEACLQKERNQVLRRNALKEAEFYSYVNNAKISLL